TQERPGAGLCGRGLIDRGSRAQRGAPCHRSAAIVSRLRRSFGNGISGWCIRPARRGTECRRYSGRGGFVAINMATTRSGVNLAKIDLRRRRVTMFFKPQHIHFVGIGGIGMSGIAEVLLNLGYRITGSDLRSSPITERLE